MGWVEIKNWFYKYIGGLFMENKDGQQVVSIGRIMLLITFLIMIYFWIFKNVQGGGGTSGKLEMPDMLYETFVALSAYVFGTKIAGALKSWKTPSDQS